MENNEKTILIAYWQKRARQALDESELLLENSFFNSSVCRLYYACLYAVFSLLNTKDIKAKKDAQVKRLFRENFISTGIIDNELWKFYSLLYKNWQKEDSGELVEYSKEEIESFLPPARKFIAQVDHFLLSQS